MSTDSQNLAAAIERWFHLNEDGEFSIVPAEVASARVGSSLTARTLIYTTKHHCLSRIEVSELVQPTAALARYGLPCGVDVEWLRGGSHEITRLFFGDADPPDLLVFAWLREHVSIQWAGVSDHFLKARGYNGRPDVQIRLADSERAAVGELARLCPGYRELLGESCARLLERGLKIELEGALIR